MTTPIGEVLPWDSEFFGCRIGRVHGGRLDRERLAAVDAWCRAEAVEGLYFLADAEEAATAAVAEEGGFRLVDLRVTLEREAAALAAPVSMIPIRAGLRTAVPADLPELRRIAAASHHDSRFYADPHFDRARCDALYAVWIEKSVWEMAADASAYTVLVPGETGRPDGYITCLLRPGEGGPVGEIGLLAVAAGAQGKGWGGALVGAALRWFLNRGAVRVRVVTQGRNVRAQRLYQAHGLLTRSIGLWFHRWGSRGRETS